MWYVELAFKTDFWGKYVKKDLSQSTLYEKHFLNYFHIINALVFEKIWADDIVCSKLGLNEKQEAQGPGAQLTGADRGRNLILK
jgi:hypothetical protein